MAGSTANSKLKSILVQLTPWLLFLATTAVLLANRPENSALAAYAGQLMVYLVLTALALSLGDLLTEGELSVAHVVGILAFLSLPQHAIGATLWSLALGGVFGGLLLIIRSHLRLSGRRRQARTLSHVAYLTARVTLSAFVAGRMYIALQGELPAPSLDATPNIWQHVLALIVFSLFYIAVYFGIFILELNGDGRRVMPVILNNLRQIFGLLFLPIPFAILGANIAQNIELPNFTILVVGMVLVMLGLHAYSRSEYRLRKQLDELRSLSVVTQAMRAHLNLDTLLKTVYLQVAHLLDVENFFVALHDEDEKSLNFPLVIRYGAQEEKFNKRADSLDIMLLNHVLATQSPLLLSDDVYERAQAIGLTPPRELVYSWLGVPLVAGGHVMGAMVVTSHDPRQHFGADDLRLLNIIAASASIAIENAQLYNQQTARANQLATLNDISSLLSGTLSPDSVLDTIISSASTIASADAVAVYLFWDETNSVLALVRSAGLSQQFSLEVPTPLVMQNQTAETLHKKPPLVIGNRHIDQRAASFGQIMTREKKTAWVELPLTVGEIGLGVLVLYYDDPQNLSGDQVELMRTFANQAAQAINNARLYTTADKALERRVEQLFALAAMGRLLTATMDIRQIGDLILNYATDATRATRGVVMTRTSAGNRVEVLAQVGFPDNTFSNPTILLQGLTGQVLDSGDVLRSGDVRKEPGYLPLMQSTLSQLIVPILRGKEVVGAIRLESEEANAFGEEDNYFVGQIASQAVIAIDNVRLFQRITEARDRLQVLLDAMEEAIILIDNSGKIVLANPSVSSLIQLKPAQLLDKNVLSLLDDDTIILAERIGFRSRESLRRFIQDLPRLDAVRDIDPITYQVQAEHGLLYLQRQVIPVRDESGKGIGVLLVFYNKTEEQELARARDDLSQMVVHDLRSPLTAVTTSLRLLQELVPDTDDLKPVIDATTDASQRAIRKLLSRVDALLDISKMESGQLTLETEPTELATLVDSICVELSPLAHELDVKLESQVDEELPLLNVDRDKVERLLLNLVDNALKYTPAESTVVIRAHKPGTAGAKEHFVRIDVVDNGPGVPDEHKSRLFDRFVQIEGRRKVRRGVGLGLTFCRMTAEAHGGRIWIEDNDGGGSVFALTLPVVRLDVLMLDD